jgi:acyl CoA:acetate/3-ketoacid CoA transferase beta subunit
MGLVAGAGRVIVGLPPFSMDGRSRLVPACTYPLTGEGEADLIVTELVVFRFPGGCLTLEEIAPEVDLDTLVRLTQARFQVSGGLKTMAVE